MTTMLDAFLEVDCAARVLMRVAGNSRQRDQLRDALQDLRADMVRLVAEKIASGAAFDIEVFKEIVRRGASDGHWQEMAVAFNQIGREGGER